MLKAELSQDEAAFGVGALVFSPLLSLRSVF